MRAGALAAGRAGRGKSQAGFDVVLDLGRGGADEEEDAEQREGRGGWVESVDGRSEAGGKKAEGREALAGVGAVEEGDDAGDRNQWFHDGGRNSGVVLCARCWLKGLSRSNRKVKKPLGSARLR